METHFEASLLDFFVPGAFFEEVQEAKECVLSVSGGSAIAGIYLIMYARSTNGWPNVQI
jgi:hypothetical protein